MTTSHCQTYKNKTKIGMWKLPQNSLQIAWKTNWMELTYKCGNVMRIRWQSTLLPNVIQSVVICPYPCVKSHKFFTPPIIMEFKIDNRQFAITVHDEYQTIICTNLSTNEVFEKSFNQFDIIDFMVNVYAKHYHHSTTQNSAEKSLFRHVIHNAFDTKNVIVEKTDENALHVLVKLTEVDDVFPFVMKRNDWKSNDLRMNMCYKLIGNLREENDALKLRVEELERDLARING